MNQKQVSLGPISEGTLDTMELIEAFYTELKSINYDRATKIHMEYVDVLATIGEYDSLTDAPEEIQEDAGFLLEELMDALQEYAPPYCYFGAHPGDGACFGFFPDIEAMDYDRRHNELPDIDNEEGIIPEFAVQVNDHGNVTLYQFDGREYKEVWSVV